MILLATRCLVSKDRPGRRLASAVLSPLRKARSQSIRRSACVAALFFSSLLGATAAGTGEMPERILPGDALAIEADREPIRGATPGLVVVPRKQDPAKDPRDGAEFAASAHVYLSENGTMVRRFIIHGPDRDALPIAKRCGRMLACLWSTANARLGRTARGLRGPAVHVWLTRSGDPGGEQVRNSLYFYNVFATRSGLEWAREIAHEYGHYLFPSPSGYAQPESWASGVLGERMFLKWLIEDARTPAPDADPLPFGAAADLDEYRTKQIAPLLARVRAGGPDMASLPAADRDAFDNFTALLLYADDTYGSRVLTDLLDYLPAGGKRPTRGDDYASALALFLDAADTFQTRLAAGDASRVYVPAGSFHVTASAGTVAFGSGLDAKKVSGGWTVRAPAAAWRAIQVPAGPGDVLLKWERAATATGSTTKP